MTAKEALELLNMFTTAAQLAKARNKYEYRLKIDEATLIDLLKKAFPRMKNEINIINLAKTILEQQ